MQLILISVLQLEVVKSKIKACQSKEEVDSLKFNEKNLINKVLICILNASKNLQGIICSKGQYNCLHNFNNYVKQVHI